MSPRSKREYRETIFLRYKKASRKEKSKILDEFCVTYGCHRKHAIRVLRKFRRFTRPKPRKKGRRATYNPENIIDPLKRIWLAANLPCSKRLKVIIPLWLPGYAEQFGALPLETIKALRKISPSTIDRLLKPVRARYTKHGRSTTKPSYESRYRSVPTSGMNHIRGISRQIRLPIAENPWQEPLPSPLIW
jgi:hypothetical protein